MHHYPYQIETHDPTKKQVWLGAFTALLSHMQPEEAVEAADRALELCNKRWEAPEWVHTWQYKHNYAVGHRFGFRANEHSEQAAESAECAERPAD